METFLLLVTVIGMPLNILVGAIATALLLGWRPRQAIKVVPWDETSKLRSYNLEPQYVKEWIDHMRKRGFELYTLIPPNGNGGRLVHLMFRKVRQGRGPYNQLKYVRDWLTL